MSFISVKHNLKKVVFSHVAVDLNRLHDDVKHYSCTPRNYSVNLREELRTTNAIFFPRCLLVQRCGGNCGCGTGSWNNSCACRPTKTTLKLHEVGPSVCVCVWSTVTQQNIRMTAIAIDS